MIAYAVGLAGCVLLSALAFRQVAVLPNPADAGPWMIGIVLAPLPYLIAWTVLSAAPAARVYRRASLILALALVPLPVGFVALRFGEGPFVLVAVGTVVLLAVALAVMARRDARSGGRRWGGMRWLGIHAVGGLVALAGLWIGLMASARAPWDAIFWRFMPVFGAALSVHAVLAWRAKVRDGTASVSWRRVGVLLAIPWAVPVAWMWRDVPVAVALGWPLLMERAAMLRQASAEGRPGAAADRAWGGFAVRPLARGQSARVRLGDREVEVRAPPAWEAAVPDRPGLMDLGRGWLRLKPAGGGPQSVVAIGPERPSSLALGPPGPRPEGEAGRGMAPLRCWRGPGGAWACAASRGAAPRLPAELAAWRPSAPAIELWSSRATDRPVLLAPGLRASCEDVQRCRVEARHESGALVRATVPARRLEDWRGLRDELDAVLRSATGLGLDRAPLVEEPLGPALPFDAG